LVLCRDSYAGAGGYSLACLAASLLEDTVVGSCHAATQQLQLHQPERMAMLTAAEHEQQQQLRLQQAQQQQQQAQPPQAQPEPPLPQPQQQEQARSPAEHQPSAGSGGLCDSTTAATAAQALLEDPTWLPALEQRLLAGLGGAARAAAAAAAAADSTQRQGRHGAGQRPEVVVCGAADAYQLLQRFAGRLVGAHRGVAAAVQQLHADADAWADHVVSAVVAAVEQQTGDVVP
jgi:hypothetical protein